MLRLLLALGLAVCAAPSFAVTGLQVIQQGQQVLASWDAHPAPLVVGYHIERRPYGSSGAPDPGSAGMVCDVDDDGDVDLEDIRAILQARNTPASGADDPRDANGDGNIDILDARACVLRCNLPGCEVIDAPPGGGAWQRLNAAPVSATEYIDTTVQNGNAYEYRVIAVDAQGVEIESSFVANLMFAYNDRALSQASAAWSNYRAELTWTLALEANETVRVYRGAIGAGDIAFDGAASSFTDAASQWSEDQRYQLVSVLAFDNPISGGVEQREGPAVELLLAALPALAVTLEDAVRTGTDSWQIESPVGVSLGIVGEFDNAVGAVGVGLAYSGGTLNAQVDANRFQFVVRDVQRESFTINLVEAGAPADRNVTLTLDVIADNTPLTLQLDNPPLAASNAASVAVSGRLLNLDGGVRRLRATSDRFPGLGFGLTLVEGGQFFGDVPLEFGDNQVGVDALAGNGEAASAGILVTRAAPAVPSIQFTSHTPNQIVNQNRINLGGRLYSSLRADQIQLRVGGVDTPVSEVSPGIYAFTRSGVELAFGFNQIVARAQTPLGSSQAAIAIYFQDSVSDPALPLKLELTTPGDGQIVNDDVLLVRGQLLNATASPAVSVNGVPAALFGSAARGWLFNAAIDIGAQLDGDVVVSVEASASGKTPVQKIVTVSVDRADPQLAVDNPLQAPPEVNEIVDKPFVLTGTVSDSNLAAVTLNGLEVTLSPGSGAGNFTFESSLALPRGVPTAITLLAVDRAGNETGLDFELLSNPGPVVDVIQPLAGAEYVVFNNSQLIETIARVSDAPAGSTLVIAAGSASNQQAVNQEFIASDLTVEADPSIDEIRFTLRDAGGAAIASQAVPITVVDGANIPLGLERTVPAQSDRFREPHHPVQFYFNRPVSLADIVVDVRETVHGVSYSSERKSGATLGEMYQGATVEVHKDQEPVAGALSLLPGERIVEFYPDADLSYGARVFVSLGHQGEQLVRFFYDVRSNPTFVKVAINDQAGQPVPGVVVSLPELGFESVSGDNGTLVLGSTARAELEVETRLYRLLVNPGLKNPRYGTRELQVQINAGQVNNLTSLRLPELSPNVPFRLLQSGISDNLLVGGDLRIDTLNAVLTFADGRDRGQVHVQMANYTDGLYAASDIDLAPLWMFNLQPGPIRVRGQIGLVIRMPTLFGTHDYVPDSGTRVLLMGLDHGTGLVEPIGVGRIDGIDVVSEGVLRATRLDFIGYQFIAADKQALARRYAEGEIDLDALEQGILE